MMEESAHGKLTPVDQRLTGTRLLGLFTVTVITALIVIYVIAGLKSGDFTWHPLAHDIVKHSLESSVL